MDNPAPPPTHEELYQMRRVVKDSPKKMFQSMFEMILRGCNSTRDYVEEIQPIMEDRLEEIAIEYSTSFLKLVEDSIMYAKMK
jgi:hypothetical protein